MVYYSSLIKSTLDVNFPLSRGAMIVVGDELRLVVAAPQPEVTSTPRRALEAESHRVPDGRGEPSRRAAPPVETVGAALRQAGKSLSLLAASGTVLLRQTVEGVSGSRCRTVRLPSPAVEKSCR